ncbi:unnamed protein product [Candida parapsilosis]
MAQAGARFAGSILNVWTEKRMSLNVLLLIHHCLRMKVSISFSSKVTLGVEGVKQVHGLGNISTMKRTWSRPLKKL